MKIKSLAVLPIIGTSAVPFSIVYNLNQPTSLLSNIITNNEASTIKIIEPSWTHYAIDEKLDLRDIKVMLNGNEDVTNKSLFYINNEQVATGYQLSKEGRFNVTVKYDNLVASFSIYVESEPKEVKNPNPYAVFGDIKVEFILMSNQECILCDGDNNSERNYGYVEGHGTLVIPDYVERNGIKYFIKRIPDDWSNGENDITGLEFASDVSHLKIIDRHAFYNTNCLDEYNTDKTKICKFPEGLEEIRFEAFYGTFYSDDGGMRGYDFPSTLKCIERNAFGETPLIGNKCLGELYFRNQCGPKGLSFGVHAFEAYGNTHQVTYLYAPTEKIAKDWIFLLSDPMVCGFDTQEYFLHPCVIKDK